MIPSTGVGYRGGKTARNRSGVGKWIASLLPYARTYVEPFAGLAGILLQRQPAMVEILNDKDDDIVNWWMCVRDSPTEFDYRLRTTPISERVFERSRALLDSPFRFNGNGADLARGVAAHVVMSQSILRTTGASSWALSWAAHPTQSGLMRNQPDTARLAARLERVQLVCRDAIEVLDREASNNEDTLIYCDPPYGESSSMSYPAEVDRDALREVLARATARCAVSGYKDDWDCLGWHRHEFSGKTVPPNYDPEKHNRDRDEALWTNFVPRSSIFQETPDAR